MRSTGNLFLLGPDLQARTEAKREERKKERYDAHNRKIFKGKSWPQCGKTAHI